MVEVNEQRRQNDRLETHRLPSVAARDECVAWPDWDDGEILG